MAGDDERAEKYIMDIPYSVLFNIVQSLDADKGWEALAAETGYTFDKIRLLELEGARLQGSPTRSLLLELGSRNTTIRRLYGYLSSIRRYREMKIIEDYVNSPVASSSGSLNEGHGLKGLKSCEFKSDTCDSLKGLKPPNVSLRPDKKRLTNSTINDSINFNQPVSGCDTNNSMQLADKDKRYTGKQIPLAAESGGHRTDASDECRQNVNVDSNTIKAPLIKPNAAVTGRAGAGASTIKDILKQMPGDWVSSSSSSSMAPANRVGSHSSMTSSTPSLFSDIPSSSSLSSMPCLDSFPAWLDSSVEMQVATLASACFTYQELREATRDFSDTNKLGEGAFGTVYYGLLRHTKCAVKKMAETNGPDSCVERSAQVKREMTSLLKYRHENLVTLYGYSLDGSCLCLVYQYMPNGSLEDRLMCKQGIAPLLWAQRLNIMVGACQGLNFLHTMGQQPLIHGDIKSANILLDKHMEARLGDLGQAQQATGRDPGGNSSRLTHITRAQTTTKLYGTRAYQPTEVQTGGKLSVKSDIFAMGVVVLEVFTGQQAYDDRREGDKYLANYFRNNVTNKELEKWLPQMDSRGGDCPREIAMALLQLAYCATGSMKKDRPNSSAFLQQMTAIEQQYTDLTGHGAAESMVGSEHSCHMSHTSSPNTSRVDNLSGAPRIPATTHGRAVLGQKRDSPSPGQARKEFVASVDLQHRADNRLAVNLNRMDSEGMLATGGWHVSESVTPSPIDVFPQGEVLPVAFRLQQEYDRQKQSQAERKKISRLSECYPTRVLGHQEERLPQSDPAKLAALEQFDRLNLGQADKQAEKRFDLDPAHLKSDPKKLEALKQFDSATTPPLAMKQGQQKEKEESDTVEGELVCDPKKLAYLRQFDEDNIRGGDGVCTSSDTANTSDGSLASDPCKLAYLTQFDEKNYSSPGVSAPFPSGGSDSEQSTLKASDSFPVSQVDYVIMSSQRETLRACNESLLHENRSQSFTPSSRHVLTQNVKQGTPVAGGSNSAPSAAPCAEAMLTRQRNFFEMYEQAKAMQGTNSDEDYDNEDYDEEAVDGVMNEEYETDGARPDEYDEADVDRSVGGVREGDSCHGEIGKQMPVMISGSAVAVGLCHPAPTEQDEESNINLDYFKEHAQYYGKTFKKTTYAAQC